MSRVALLLVAVLAVGCAKPRVPAPPPEDSEADIPPPPIWPGAERTPDRGHPGRAPANLFRVVRGDVEVWVDSASAGERLYVQLTVANRNKEKPLAFANWDKPDRVTLKDDRGRTYPLVPLSAERSGPSARGRRSNPTWCWRSGPGRSRSTARATSLEFGRSAEIVQYLDLDLDGAPVGFADPILFRIPGHMIATGIIGVPR